MAQNEMAKVTIKTDEVIETTYAIGTTYEKIADEFQKKYNGLIALCIVNGKICELTKKVERNCTVSFLTLQDEIGHKTYERTATMMLIKAVYDVLEKEQHVEKIKVEFAIGQGCFCSLKADFKIKQEFVDRINHRMTEMVEQRIPIKKKSIPLEDAVELFKKQGMTDKIKLFRYRRSSSVNVYSLDGFYDYYYGYMLPDTGYLKYFNVIAYEDGLMLILPYTKQPDKIEFFEPRENLFRTLRESTIWNQYNGINTVGDLNDWVCHGNLADLILVQEAEQERKIGEIAKDIVRRGGVKFVMIAGPSSSGKTTFSHRLSIQLRTLGMVPHPIALDNYFVNRENTPLDENGNYNFECLEAIDVELFNQNMCELLAGKTVEMPEFNFLTGQREYHGSFMKLGAEDVLVIEGIHGLNDKMSYALPNDSKYKIYISALTSLNIDAHNRISTTDGRLLRRMVRDARTRGASAKKTIAMWPSVRKGEEENIFPYQESADAMFNSVLIYELAVLKQYAEPLLFCIDKEEPEYFEAKRLLKFLEYFLGIDSTNLPQNSICREFIGGSCFNV